jgi:arginyl-tRNA synthetase
MVPENLRSDALKSIKAAGLSKKEVVFEFPPPGIGSDLALPCFSLAKKTGKRPDRIALDISGKARPSGLIKRVEPSGPYVNFYADWKKLGNMLLAEILEKKEKFGRQKGGGKVMVEFAQPNTHKEFHMGHVRNICLGESVCRILEFAGFRVIRANYQGDIGPHVARCLWGVINLKERPPSKGRGRWLGKIYAMANRKIEECRKEDEARIINQKLYGGDRKIRKLWKETRKWSLDYFDSIYREFGTVFDRLYFESEVEGPAVKLAKSLLKKGTARMSEGAIVMDLKKFNLGVFVLLTKDQTPLYSVKDLVLAGLQEKEFRPEKIIHVVAAEQKLYFRQLFKTLEIVNPRVAGKEFHLSYELVNLRSGKMSSRLGQVITYDELKSEVLRHAISVTRKHSPRAPEKTPEVVAMGAIKYDMLKQSPEKTITFDWKQALSFEGNAAPYIQYTHARTCSIFAKAGIKKTGKFDAGLLDGKRESGVLKKLFEFPAAVESAARDYRPHYIANYVFELASLFNDFYQNVPVLKSSPDKRMARIALVKACQQVIKNSLFLLGIEAPEKM